jgi:hypothetical protein
MLSMHQHPDTLLALSRQRRRDLEATAAVHRLARGARRRRSAVVALATAALRGLRVPVRVPAKPAKTIAFTDA